MGRGRIREMLDEAITESRIVLLNGLPRVGRSQLVQAWCDGRTDATLEPFVPEGGDKSAVMVFDHLVSGDVPAFVARFRTSEKAKSQTRFVVAPADLLAARLIHAELAGSVLPVELAPLQLDDVVAERGVLPPATVAAPALSAEATATPAATLEAEAHWLRGGLPQSLAASGDQSSLRWRRHMLNGLLARDYASWGITAASRFPEVFHWIATQNGGELDEVGCPIAKRAELLTALRVLDDIGLTRRLPNFAATPSLARKPKVYVRDSGVLHALLGVENTAQLRGHPDVGASWEAYAIEALIHTAGGAGPAYFFRLKGDQGGEQEIDLLLDLRLQSGRLVAIECKIGPEAPVKSGFYAAAAAVGATDRFVVHAGRIAQLGGTIDRLDLLTSIHRLSQLI